VAVSITQESVQNTCVHIKHWLNEGFTILHLKVIWVEALASQIVDVEPMERHCVALASKYENSSSSYVEGYSIVHRLFQSNSRHAPCVKLNCISFDAIK
jgi:hypothetical protein